MYYASASSELVEELNPSGFCCKKQKCLLTGVQCLCKSGTLTLCCLFRSVNAAQQTLFICVIKTTQLIIYTEIIAELLYNFEGGSVYSNLYDLKNQ
jgi:hypothetical protein